MSNLAALGVVAAVLWLGATVLAIPWSRKDR